MTQSERDNNRKNKEKNMQEKRKCEDRNFFKSQWKEVRGIVKQSERYNNTQKKRKRHMQEREKNKDSLKWKKLKKSQWKKERHTVTL